VCVGRVFRAVVSHRRLHVNFRTWNQVKNKCPSIFRATVNGRDLTNWTKHSGSDIQAGRPQAGAHVSTKGVWEYETKLPKNATQKNQQFVLRFVFLCLKFYFWVQRNKKLVFLQKQQDQICIVSAPTMFPQHCYKTRLRVFAVMRGKKVDLARQALRLKQPHLSLFFNDRLDQHQESWYEKNPQQHLA